MVIQTLMIASEGLRLSDGRLEWEERSDTLQLQHVRAIGFAASTHPAHRVPTQPG